MADDTKTRLAREIAEALVTAGPELTGTAAPECWWVYLAGGALSDLRLTREEAERIAASYRPGVEREVLRILEDYRVGPGGGE